MEKEVLNFKSLVEENSENQNTTEKEVDNKKDQNSSEELSINPQSNDYTDLEKAKDVINIILEESETNKKDIVPKILETKDYVDSLVMIFENELHFYESFMCKLKNSGVTQSFIDSIKRVVKKELKKKKESIENTEIIDNSKNEEIEEEEIDPEVEKMSLEIAIDPLLFKKRIDIINELGIVNERKNIGMFFTVLDSRLLPKDKKSPNWGFLPKPPKSTVESA